MSNKDTSKESVVRAAYADLNKFGQNGEYEKALKAVNRILGVTPDDETALHSKVVCLIQVAKFQEAYQFIEKNKLSNLVFEKAYCEYRLNQSEKALKTIESVGVNNLPNNLKELYAQVLYRLERYEECYDTYREIIKNTHDDYDDERKTNLSAVVANLAATSSKDLPTFEEDSYEIVFNASCALINKGLYSEAEKKLKVCEKMCREALEEDGLSEEEIQEEVAVIRVQLAYCLQIQGKSKEAVSIYSEVLKNKPKDAALVAVASNNSVVYNKDQNVFDSKKKMRAALSDACEHKLTSWQKKAIMLNNCLLGLYANAAELPQLLNKLVQTYPELEYEALHIKVGRLVKDKKFKEAIELVEKTPIAEKEKQFGCNFLRIQLHLMNGNRKAAIETLESLGDLKYKPGVVSALVTLYLGLDNKQAAANILKEAVEWYKKGKDKSGDLSDMWRQAAEFHLRGGEAETAAASLEELLKINPNDMKVVAQLVIAYAQFDPERAQKASKLLPPFETLTTPAEIDALESANWMMNTKAIKKTGIKSDQSPGTPGTDLQKKKTKRKRKGKLPKNYNPDVPPDPERWLPKYERTGYRRKRDRRAKDVIKGSQGMASGAADQYDMSKQQNLGKNSPATPAFQEPTPGPRHQHRKGGQNKKKKGRH